VAPAGEAGNATSADPSTTVTTPAKPLIDLIAVPPYLLCQHSRP
jgi:hypothetical protein